MTDYAKMRRNMVDGQLRTNGIITPTLLAQFLSVPRENFLTGDLKKSAYIDEDISLSDGTFLLQPLVLARLLTAVAIQPGDRVLDIGDATGYTAALLTGLGVQVTRTVPATGAFDVILLNGAVAALPESLLKLLDKGGRLVAVLRPPGAPTGLITVAEHDGAGVYAYDRRQDAAAPYLPGYAPAAVFEF